MPTNKTPDELRQTLSWISEAASYNYMATQEYARALRELHNDFGDNPNELVLDLERQLTAKLHRSGVQNRYDDELAKQAGTYQETPPAPTLYEVEAYLSTIGLAPKAIQLVRKVEITEDSTVYVEVGSGLLTAMKDDILRAMQRTMPPRLVLKLLDEAAGTGFVERMPTHQLCLRAYNGEDWNPETSTLEYVMKEMQTSAMKASKVFKDAGGATIPFRVCLMKEDKDSLERIVTGVVLEPEVIDTTKDAEEETEGDIYSEAEIQGAMYWWMENARGRVAYHHVEKGGRTLGPGEVVPLENWQTRIKQKIGKQVIKAGTWMRTEKILNDDLWSDILNGEIKSWSIGAAAMGAVERVKA